MEMIRGYQKKQASRQLQTFLIGISSEEVLSFDRADTELAGWIAGELQRGDIGVIAPGKLGKGG
jgi:hypothetical protein